MRIDIDGHAVVRHAVYGVMAGLLHAGIPCDIITGEGVFQAWSHLTSHHNMSFKEAREAMNRLIDIFERENQEDASGSKSSTPGKKTSARPTTSVAQNGNAPRSFA